MKVTLTGATGFVGSHVLTELHEHGHEVTALVRDDDQARAASTARGATPIVVDLYDRPAVATPAKWGGRGHSYRQSRRRDQREPGLRGGRRSDRGVRRHRQALPPHQRPVDLRRQHLDQRGVAVQATCAGGMEGADRTPGPRRPRHARSRDRLQRRLRRRRRRDSRAASQLTPRRRRQPDHARHRTTALVDRPRCGPCEVLPARARVRLGPRPLRRRGWIEPDRRRTDRGGRCRSRRSRSGPRFR